LTKSRVSFHEDFDREDKVEGSSDRNFGLTLAGVCALLGVLKLWRGSAYWWPWAIGCAIALAIALLIPQLFRPANRLWLKLGLIMFRVISPIVTALLFYLCMVPVGLLMRASGRDPMRQAFEAGAPSYWIKREALNSVQSMKNQF
jgi:hypothetical protein